MKNLTKLINGLHFKEPSAIQEFQMTEIQKMLEYIKEKSPFYKKALKDLILPKEGTFDYTSFRKLPFTTKDHLQAQNFEFLCIDRSEIAEISSTSGTLGSPVFIAQSSNDLDRLGLNEAMTLELAGVKKGELIQLMTTMDKRFMAGLAYFLGTQKFGAGIIRTGSGVPELQWDTIMKLKPSVIIAVPSFIVQLIQYAKKHNISFQTSSVKKAICIGEPIRNDDFSLNTLGKNIRDQWDIELYSTYASTEMAAAFSECSHGKGGHLTPELLFVEVLDENGVPINSGETGEIVITTLGVEAMPLLRFKTGDICRLHQEKCSCGRNTLRLGPVLGRDKQMIKFKGTTLYPPALFNILNEVKEIHNYLVEVSLSDLGTDDITIYLSSNKETDELLFEIKSIFQSKLRVVPKLHFMSLEAMVKIQSPDMNRKPIRFIDKRNL